MLPVETWQRTGELNRWCENIGGQEQPNTVNPNNPDVERLDRAERAREGSVKIPAGKLPALGLDFCWLYSLFLSLDKDEFDVMFSSMARWTQLHGEALHRQWL